MAAVKEANAPTRRPVFGTTANRFSMASVHPQNRTPGSYLQVAYLKSDDPSCLRGPGRYNVEKGGFATEAVNERAQGPGWFDQVYTEQEAAKPRVAFATEWNKRKQLDEELGPGKYPTRDEFAASSNRPVGVRGAICRRTEDRFGPKDKFRGGLPGPGAYGIPQEGREKRAKESFGTRGMLSQGDPKTRSLGYTSRALTGNDRNEAIAPNKYEVTRFPAQRFPDRRVGPCDLNRARKSAAAKTGHFGVPARSKLGPGQYPVRSFTDEMHDPGREKQGKMSKCDFDEQPPTQRIQISYLPQVIRQPDDPGPDKYFDRPRTRSAVDFTQSHGDLHSSRAAKAPQGIGGRGTNQKRPVTASVPVFGTASSRTDDIVAKRFFGSHSITSTFGTHDVNSFHDGRHVNGHTYVFDSAHQRLLPAGNEQDAIKLERLQTKNSTLTRRDPLIAD